jgi:hypothetical protein
VYRNILVYNSNKTHKSQSSFNLTTDLHVSGVTITRIQEHKTPVTCRAYVRLNKSCDLCILLELYTRILVQEVAGKFAVVGSVYCSFLRNTLVQYYSINVMSMNIAFTLLCVGRTFFGRGEPGCFHYNELEPHSSDVLSYVRVHVSYCFRSVERGFILLWSPT